MSVRHIYTCMKPAKCLVQMVYMKCDAARGNAVPALNALLAAQSQWFRLLRNGENDRKFTSDCKIDGLSYRLSGYLMLVGERLVLWVK